MTHHTPSRLPTAFVRVSKCPICRYSLKDLSNDADCPECGHDIDRDLYTSVEMQNAVAVTRTWCTLGIIAWCICGLGYWALNSAQLHTMNYYIPGSSGPLEYTSVWLKACIAIAPVVVSYSWGRNARRLIYRAAVKREPHRVTTLRKAVALNMMGIGLLTGTCVFGLVAQAI